MATTTPNFGWSVPTSTDLVKDGATAIETLGDSIDASLVDLKGGTSGQVLAKNSGTDMDFIWVAQDDSNAIQNAIVDAKGDLISATAADTPARLAVGTNGHVLTADSTTATGIKWAAPAGGGKVLQVVQATATGTSNTTSTTYVDTNLSATITPTSATSKVLVMVTHNAEVFVNSNLGSASAAITILRGATDIIGNPVWNVGIAGASSANLDLATPWNFMYLDSPATTSATTYKTQMKVESGRTIYVNLSGRNQTSTMILMEIGA